VATGALQGAGDGAGGLAETVDHDDGRQPAGGQELNLFDGLGSG
jgi:hypothetical protein